MTKDNEPVLFDIESIDSTSKRARWVKKQAKRAKRAAEVHQFDGRNKKLVDKTYIATESSESRSPGNRADKDTKMQDYRGRNQKLLPMDEAKSFQPPERRFGGRNRGSRTPRGHR